jgi:predicted TIM-barrel fold metal-dependent hydrolase
LKKENYWSFIGPAVVAALLVPGWSGPGTLSDLQERKIGAEHHLHIRSAVGAEMAGQFGGPPITRTATTAADALAALDAASISRGLVLSIAYMFGSPSVETSDEYAKVRAENDYVAREVATAPGRLVGACSVNPLAAYALMEIERCAKDSRLGALKLHFANSQVNLLEEAHVGKVAEIFGTANRLRLPIVVHFRADESEYAVETEVFIDAVLSQATDIDVQIAHMGGWGGYDDATHDALGIFIGAIETGRLDATRLTFGLGAVVFQPEAAGADSALANSVRQNNLKLAGRIRQIGLNRVVFATDWPSWPPVRNVTTGIERNARLFEQSLPLTPEELKVVLGNANPIAMGVGLNR